jgi:hypothetical protein
MNFLNHRQSISVELPYQPHQTRPAVAMEVGYFDDE